MLLSEVFVDVAELLDACKFLAISGVNTSGVGRPSASSRLSDDYPITFLPSGMRPVSELLQHYRDAIERVYA